MLLIVKNFKKTFLTDTDNSIIEKYFILSILSHLIVIPFWYLILSTVGILMLIVELISKPFTINYKKLYKKIHNKFYPIDIKSIIRQHGKELDKKYNFYLYDFEHNKNQKLFDFIYMFIQHYRRDYYTKDNSHRIICGLGRRRSLGDIYLISKHYYPNCKIEEVLECLIKMIDRKQVCAGYCHDTQKFMFHTDSNNYGLNSKTEYGEGFTFRDVMKTYNY